MVRPALHAVVLVCVVTAGCSVLGPDPTREERAVTAVENAMDAAAVVDTYRYDSDLDVTATADGETRTVSVSVSGAVDIPEKRLQSTSRQDAESYRTFALNRTVYRECRSPWDGYGVTERDVDGNWSDTTPLFRQLGLLESGSVHWNGTTTLDGQEAALVTGEPTERAVTRYQDSRSGSLLGGPSIDDARIRVWLDPETDLPVKTEFRFEVRGNGGTATARMTTRFRRYDDPVSVELPSEARTDQYDHGCPGE